MTAPTLMTFILAMLKTAPHTAARADATRLAAKYQIPEATARGFLDAWSRT